MDPYLITIDGGTTNTRFSLWHGDDYLADLRSPIGVSITAASGSHDAIRCAVRNGIRTLLENAHLTSSDMTAVVASGMITSELGLMEVPHLEAPVSLQQLADAMVRTGLEDITSIPIYFVPGIKNFSGTSFESMDIMRGEETEAAAIIGQETEAAAIIGQGPTGSDRLLVLPGSHTKFVAVNAEGEITGCLTSLAGELLSAVTCHTILQDAVKGHFTKPEEYNKEAVMSGYMTAKEVGLSRALFSGRILSRFAPVEPVWLSNYLMGAVFSEDILALRHSSAVTVRPATRILVGGKSPFREALFDILSADGFSLVKMLPERTIPLAAEGAKLLYKLRAS